MDQFKGAPGPGGAIPGTAGGGSVTAVMAATGTARVGA